MRLVIAEKKSVATAIAQALCAAPVQRDGCYECGQLLVTWAQGHLIDLAMPEDYKDRDWGKWSLDTLPVDPSGHWQWKISTERGAGSRYRQIVQLIRRADVDCLVNACDPDREGEAIFRRIADMEGSRKPELRLWVASLEAEAIQAAWRAMKPESEYQGLAWSAEIRSKADWLTGMNASRYVEDKSLKAALDDDESHSGGIGTPATRADTIEKLVRSKLVERKGRQLHATTEGERLTDVVEPRLKDVLLTARMEQALSDVEHGKRDPADVMDMFRREALRIPADATANLKAAAVTQTTNTDAQDWGECPRCGQPVRKTGRMWQCSTNRSEKTKDGKWIAVEGCGWKMYARLAGKTITDQTARRLLAGQAVTLKGFTSKSGKKFDAAIRIDELRGTAFDFDR